MLFKNCLINGVKADIAVKNGVITDGEYDGGVTDCGGLAAFYGFFDMHCHLRDPGFTEKETVETGLLSAAKGGFTSVMPMPNTDPVCDNPETVKYILDKAEKCGVKVYPIAAATAGQKGETVTDLAALLSSGAAAFSDDGRPVVKDAVALKVMSEACRLGSFYISHCETPSLNKDGVVTPASEEAMIERECLLAFSTASRVHIAHVSTAGGAEIIRRYKSLGARVTAETCPHYFCFTAADAGDNTNFKMNPPLRGESDRLAIIGALQDGTIDVISTDHAPHTDAEKAKPYKDAPNGIIGFETAFAASYTALVSSGAVTLSKLTEILAAPYRITGKKGGKIAAGVPADLVFVDLDEKFVYDREEIRSKSHNSPFIGKTLTGRVKLTVSDGKTVYSEI